MDGVSITVSNLANKFYLSGEHVCVVIPEEPGLQAGDSPFPIFQYMSVPVPMRKPYRWGLPFFDKAFQRQISSVPFEILHAHSPFSAGNTALKIARQQGVPLVATFHSKYRDDFERAIPNRRIVDHLIRQIVDFYEYADEVWIPQASVGETLRSYGFHGAMTVVENGSEYADSLYTDRVKEEARRRLNLCPGIPTLLFVGQHIWEKNIRLILLALSRVRDLPFQMLFVGDGYARHDMIKLARELGLTDHTDRHPDKVNFMGAIYDRDLLRQIYTAADLLLFPSLYDNAPLVVREAAAMHTPALVVRGSNTAEVIRDEVNGFLAENTITDYSTRLRSLLHRPDLLSGVGDGAAATIVRSWSDIAEEVLDRYRHLIHMRKVV